MFQLILQTFATLALAPLSRWIVIKIEEKSIRLGLVDKPNERSSHKQPTPRGGGLAFVVLSLLATSIIVLFFDSNHKLAFALLAGGSIVAAVGFKDDLSGLTVQARFAMQITAAIIATAILGGLPSIEFGSYQFDVGWASFPISVFVIVWSTNLYNFMDGIDSFAGAQGIHVFSFFAGALLWLGDFESAWIAVSFALSIAGFLMRNWPPAKIFMGDVGSGFLGFSIAVFAIHLQNTNKLSLLISTIAYSAFAFDATSTLIKRTLQGKNPLKGHREHAYQVLHHVHQWPHRKISIALMVFNLVISAIGITAFLNPSLAAKAGLLTILLCFAAFTSIQYVRQNS